MKEVYSLLGLKWMAGNSLHTVYACKHILPLLINNNNNNKVFMSNSTIFLKQLQAIQFAPYKRFLPLIHSSVIQAEADQFY